MLYISTICKLCLYTIQMPIVLQEVLRKLLSNFGARETKSYCNFLNISIYVKHVSIALTSSRLKVYDVISFERSSLLACRLSNLCNGLKRTLYNSILVGMYSITYITTEID